ncbi:hypothetical protein AMJ44_14425 [candidate division WOR-1 bacterium DG_54_3]|uniref:Uncharacterized protein n=1 Tax=candidate division WOR-1 bacterium DG_54_3 TaxID=1703775 RepID=A0A0S7XLT7_UNCSA|nr:MAG: hypothetical protein AMJ44_14425 [candidate division WOR-1 bacterium DG_54_3]
MTKQDICEPVTKLWTISKYPKKCPAGRHHFKLDQLRSSVKEKRKKDFMWRPPHFLFSQLTNPERLPGFIYP